MPISPKVEMIASICSASTKSSGRWSLISEYVRKPRSLPSLIRFLRRVRRVSASSLGSSAGISQASFPPRRPPRPPLPLDLTSATLASRSSSACLALLTGVFGALAEAATAGLAELAFAGTLPRATAGAFARSGFLWTLGARALTFRRLTTLAFFFAARTFLTLDFDLRFWTIRPPELLHSDQLLIEVGENRTL